MKNNELHVVPTTEGWQISPPPEPDETFDTRTEAVLAAVQVAEIENLEVVIHADDGTIQELIETNDSNIAFHRSRKAILMLPKSHRQTIRSKRERQETRFL